MISKSVLVKKNELFRAANEIAALQILKHPNIISLYQVLESRSRVFLVLEHAKGGELFDHICAQGRIRDERQARVIFRDIVKGLAYMHSEGFHHRDLKPENMLFDEGRVLKLIDLGLISMPGEDHTRTSCGSANYAAPEVIQGDLYRAEKGDTWSLGIVLYAMLCGFLPFDDSDLKALGAKIRSGVYSEPTWLSSSARSLIRGLVCVNPQERLSMREVLKHPWVIEGLPDSATTLDYKPKNADQKMIDMQIVTILARHYGKSESTVLEQVRRDAYDHVTADYQLMQLAKKRLQPVFLYSSQGYWSPRVPKDAKTAKSKSSTSASSAPTADAKPAAPVPSIAVKIEDEDDNSDDSDPRDTSSLSQKPTAIIDSPRSQARSPRGRRRGNTASSSQAPNTSSLLPEGQEVVGRPHYLSTSLNETGSSSASGTATTGRRRGYTQSSPMAPNKLTTLFRRLTMKDRDMPTIADTHLLINYRTRSPYEEIRSLFAAFLKGQDPSVRIKEKSFACSVSLCSRITGFQDIRVMVEFMRIGVTEDIGLRFKRIKGDASSFQRFVASVKTDFAKLDPQHVATSTEME